LLTAGACFTASQAHADAWVNWDVKYLRGTGAAGNLDVVLKGGALSAASTYNGGFWWPNGEGFPPVPAPNFQGFAFQNTTLNTIISGQPATPVTDLRWSFPNGAITPGNGIHIGAQVVGTVTADFAGVATVFFSDANGNRLVGSTSRIVELGATYTAPPPGGAAPPPPAGPPMIPATVLPGQTVSVLVPVAVPAGSQVVLYHQTTDEAGNFAASAFTELDPAPAGGAPSFTISVSNDWANDPGEPASFKFTNVAYAVMSSRVALADLNSSNTSLMSQVVHIPVIVQNGPAMPPWALWAVGGLLVAGGAVAIRRRGAVLSA
jgi:hypothetical protein